MRAKLILIAVTAAVAVGASGGWMLVSNRHLAEQQRASFFATSKELPTIGGQKMKPEW